MQLAPWRWYSTILARLDYIMTAVDDLKAAIGKMAAAVSKNTDATTNAAAEIKQLAAEMAGNTEDADVEDAANRIAALADTLTSNAFDLAAAVPAMPTTGVQASVTGSQAGSPPAGSTQATSAASDVQPATPSADVSNTTATGTVTG